jgi:MFS family permease
MFTGIGMMIGPLAGGLLYEVGGYITPFLVLGLLLLFLGIGCYFIDVSDLVIYSAEAELNDVKTSILSILK